MSFLNKFKAGTASNTTSPASKEAQNKKKDEPAPEITPLEKMLQNAGPLRQDGSDKFFGLENFGNTCYCNSMVQALYYTTTFRDHVLNYPPLTPSETPNGDSGHAKVNVSIRTPVQNGTPPPQPPKKLTTAQAMAARRNINFAPPAPINQVPVKPEDKPDTPEYKKKQAMLKGPILELAQENPGAYGMDECTFTGLRDIFMALVQSNTRTGVLSPQRFLEIFKRDNEMFRNSMHQDAHEFYGLVLNDVISNVEANARKMIQRNKEEGLTKSVQNALGAAINGSAKGTESPGTGWVHNIFEGVLTSETKCLTCETTSQRDETFLDLSIDLEEHSSVTSCLRKFSAEEMLCERNKFHCDHCGGLQEAEKRMKIKRLPKVLALHLKRFKYTEDYSRLQKLFHRVVYPYQLRMFNTTDDADDQDRLYELYAVVIHIGGNAYHGHYVSVIKTEDRGWLLFDDEMVEPVDKHYVKNFFGDKPGMACAYVLFYQETTFEKMRAEQEAEGLEEVRIAGETADVAQEKPLEKINGTTPGLSRQFTTPQSPVEELDAFVGLDHAQTAPEVPTPPVAMASATNPLDTGLTRSETVTAEPTKTKEDKKEAKAAEKARKQAEKDDLKQRKEREAREREALRQEQEDIRKALEASKKEAPPTPTTPVNSLSRSNKGSKSMSRKSFGFLSKEKRRDSVDVVPETTHNGTGESSETAHLVSGDQGDHSKLKDRFSLRLGKKKSNNGLS